jgi:hypothetical protein
MVCYSTKETGQTIRAAAQGQLPWLPWQSWSAHGPFLVADPAQPCAGNQGLRRFLGPTPQLSDFRLAVAWTGTHVVALFNDDDGAFRVYDNDSDERLLGTFKTMRADEIIDAYVLGICGVLQEGSDLSATSVGGA